MPNGVSRLVKQAELCCWMVTWVLNFTGFIYFTSRHLGKNFSLAPVLCQVTAVGSGAHSGWFPMDFSPTSHFTLPVPSCLLVPLLHPVASLSAQGLLGDSRGAHHSCPGAAAMAGDFSSARVPMSLLCLLGWGRYSSVPCTTARFTFRLALLHASKWTKSGRQEEGWGGDVTGRWCKHTSYISWGNQVKKELLITRALYKRIINEKLNTQWYFILLFNLSFFQGQPWCIRYTFFLSVSLVKYPLTAQRRKILFFFMSDFKCSVLKGKLDEQYEKDSAVSTP